MSNLQLSQSLFGRLISGAATAVGLLILTASYISKPVEIANVEIRVVEFTHQAVKSSDKYTLKVFSFRSLRWIAVKS
jgi:hypothetical protein